MSAYGFAAGLPIDAALSLLVADAVPNWKMGEKLLASATHYAGARYRVSRRPDTLFRRYVRAPGADCPARARAARPRRYSSTFLTTSRLHSQAIAWQGLRAIASACGRGRASAALSLPARRPTLVGLRRALRAIERRLPHESLVFAVRLLDRDPRTTVTASGTAAN